MKYINILTAIIIATLLLSSCQDKIDVDLQQVDPSVVVDAWLTTEPGIEQKIELTYTQPYFDSSTPTKIEGALVNIAVDGDALIPFTDQGDGIYTWQPDSGDHLGNIGTEYILHITYEGIDYTALAGYNPVPPIDRIEQEERKDELGFIDGTYCQFVARDIVGVGNTYWIKTFKNGEFLNKPLELNIAVDSGFESADQSSDGIIFIPPVRELTNPLPDSIHIADEISPWTTGDICRVEIHSISHSSYRFMFLLLSAYYNGENGIFAGPITNAQGNIVASDGSEVLGVFNVAEVSSMEYVVE